MLPFTTSSFFRNLLESFPAGVVIFNSMGQAYAANTLAEGLLGREFASVAGQGYAEIFPGMGLAEAFRDFMDLAVKGKADGRAMSSNYTTPDGRNLHLNLTTALLIESGKTFGVLLALTDVTHLVELHKRERSMLEEKHALAREREMALNALASAVAHQIRNPLMSVAGMANLLGRRLTDRPDLEEYLEVIHDGCIRLEGIVKAVANYTGIRAREPGPVDLGPVVREAMARARARVPDSRVAWSVDADGAKALADAELATALVAECLANSLEAMAQGGELVVKAFSGEGESVLQIKDTGPGIPKENLAFVFDPFFTTKAVGLGMGLTAARRMAEEMDGSLEIASPPTGGTLVRLRLQLPGPVVSGANES